MSKQSDLISVSQGAAGDPLSIDTANNRVGVGTSSPDSSLHVEDDGAFPITLTRNGGTNSNAAIRWKQATTSWYAGVNATNSFAFKYDSPDLGAGNALAITSTGSVAIGTSSPAVRLHVTSSDNYVAGIESSTPFSLLGFKASGTTGTLDDANVAVGATGDALYLRSGGTERARIDASGNLLVSTTSTSTSGDNGFKFYPNGSGGGAFATFVNEGLGGTNMYLVNGNASTSSWVAILFAKQTTQVGSITCTTTTTAYNTSSDYRLKEDAQPMTGAVDRVLALKPVNFAWKLTGERVDGFLAHEAQEIVPEAVAGTKDEVDDEGNPKYQGIDQSKLVPLLTAALQEALARIETLEADVAALKGEPA